jgi:hypothetical protein
MATTLAHDVRELAQRRSADLEITLLWCRRLRRVWISILDLASDEQYAARVSPEHALDAFNHPYAYLSA